MNSENFARVLFFANNVKRHVCNVKNLRPEHDLSTFVNGRVLFAFPRGFYFRITLVNISEFALTIQLS